MGWDFPAPFLFYFMYKCIVCKLENVRKAENSDNLSLGDCVGNTVVVGKDYLEGMIGVYFPCDGVLSHEFCKANNLFPVLDENGKRIGGGYFDSDRPRVRAQKFRKNRSSGFFIGLQSLEFTGYDLTKLKIGDAFDSLNDVSICTKYVNPATLRALQDRKKGKKQPVAPLFFEHKETDQFDYYGKDIQPGALVTILSKKHGCVSGDTIVETLEMGKLTIREIVEKKLRVKVRSFDTNIGTLTWMDINDYFYIPDDGEWYEIELEDGRKLEITSENPVWLPELDCYRKVVDLRVGDFVLVSNV